MLLLNKPYLSEKVFGSFAFCFPCWISQMIREPLERGISKRILIFNQGWERLD
jgi:hypothetical protein